MGSTLSQTFHLSIPVLSSKTTKTLVSFSTIHSKYLLEDNDDSNFSREIHPNPLSQTWLSISSAVGNTSSVHIICSSPSDWERLVFLFPASLFPSCLPLSFFPHVLFIFPSFSLPPSLCVSLYLFLTPSHCFISLFFVHVYSAVLISLGI